MGCFTSFLLVAIIYESLLYEPIIFVLKSYFPFFEPFYSLLLLLSELVATTTTFSKK